MTIEPASVLTDERLEHRTTHLGVRGRRRKKARHQTNDVVELIDAPFVTVDGQQDPDDLAANHERGSAHSLRDSVVWGRRPHINGISVTRPQDDRHAGEASVALARQHDTSAVLGEQIVDIRRGRPAGTREVGRCFDAQHRDIGGESTFQLRLSAHRSVADDADGAERSFDNVERRDDEALSASGSQHALATLRTLHVDLCGLRALGVGRMMEHDSARRGQDQYAQASQASSTVTADNQGVNDSVR